MSLELIEPPDKVAFSIDSNKDNFEFINFPDPLFSLNLEDKKLIYNRHYAQSHGITGIFSIDLSIETEGLDVDKYFMYMFVLRVNGTNNSTITDLDDSPINIDVPWVQFYL